KNDYLPGREDDRGGMVVFHTDGRRFALLEEHDPDQPFTWPRLRMVMDRGFYAGFGSDDGPAWARIGSGRLRGDGMMGVTLEGTDLEGAAPYDIDWIAAYRSLDIMVGRVTVGATIELRDADDVVVTTVTAQATGAVSIRPPGPSYPFS